ncbi:hypothetical protein QG37_02111 [Candidozyma auris]|uniref:Uncharacterized protein n=1 Tax=Candidozyma auris TaxID=498019 RepID=A0A0L0P5A9_CANAR|nr:hypothetical protein QG37_02111 [[Candida] auris]
MQNVGKKEASPPGVEPGIFWFQQKWLLIVARRLDHWAMRNEAC